MSRVNANIGTSPEMINVATELEKVQNAREAGADAIMDLSTGGNLNESVSLSLITPIFP